MSKSELELSAAAQTIPDAFIVECNASEWTVKSNVDWLNVQVVGNSVLVACEENASGHQREGIISITTLSGEKADLHVTQVNPIIKMWLTSEPDGGESYDCTLCIQTDVANWRIESDQSWASIKNYNPSEALEHVVNINIHLDENTMATTRNAQISFIVGDAVLQIITITQNKHYLHFYYDMPDYTGSVVSKHFDSPIYPSATYFNEINLLTSASSFEINCNQTWCSYYYDENDKKVDIILERNDTGEDRTARIRVVLNDGQEAYVDVVQYSLK